MITGLDHIAIAVSDLPQGIKRLVEDFDLHCDSSEDVKEAQTQVAFFPLPPTNIELIHPLNGEGPVSKYLTKMKGRGGLHHISFRSDNIEADVARLKKKGYEFLSDAPTPGAHNSKVIFIHPKSCDGVLVEITEPDNTYAQNQE
jgi:methylmalonyl-CoA/ethylmalonyl-CoA epimerase